MKKFYLFSLFLLFCAFLSNAQLPDTVLQTDPGECCAVYNFGYGDYIIQDVPYSPVVGTGTGVYLSDDEVSSALPIGFDFNFYGNTYSEFYISSNGFITFTGGQSSGCCSGQDIPNSDSPNNLIALGWDDLYPPGYGSIDYFTTGTAPNRMLVVNFIDIPFCCDSNPVITSQIVLYESSNYIEIHTEYAAGFNPATMGVENIDGTEGVAVEGRNRSNWSVSTPEGVRFVPYYGTQIAGLPSGSCFPVGETVNIFQFDDGFGNITLDTFTVTVVDEQGPLITGPADVIVYSDTSACGAEVVSSELVGSVTFSEYFTQGEISPHAQAWNDFRAKLLSSYNYTKLTIKGTNDPVGVSISDPVKVTQIANALREGNYYITSDGGLNWAVGECVGGIELYAGLQDICYCTEGSYTVRAGYVGGPEWGGIITNSCNPPSQQITVEFEIATEITASDNCSSVEVEQTSGLPIGSIFPVGTTTNTYVATDGSGNQSSHSFTVTVLDTIAPTLKAKSIEIFLDESGQYTLTNDDIMDMVDDVSDDCDLEDLEIGAYPVDFSCVHVGKEPVVQIVAKDRSGNEAKDWVTITVSDTLAPVIAAIEDVEVETELCDTAAAIDYPEIIVEDNCDFAISLIAGLGANGIFPVGITTETWVATDAAGNSDTLSFDVIVAAGNDLPTLDSIADVTVDEDEAVTVDLAGISYGEDCEEQVLTVSAESLDATLVDDILINYNSGDSTGTIEIVLTPDMNGTTEITVLIEDEGGAQVLQTFILTVNPVNDAPYLITPIPDQTIHASHVLKVPVSSVVGVIFDDIDDDELSIEIVEEGTTSLPAWATMSGDTLVCEPMIENTGYYNIVVMAIDTSGATATDTFEIFVDGYPVGVGDININSFEVQMYPNPTNGQVYIDISSGIHNIDIAVIDITGRVVLQKQYPALERVVFDMSGKVAGMYFVNMNIDGERIIKKLIVDNK